MEGTNHYFPNKKDKLISHFKKCIHFIVKTTAKEREKNFKLTDVSKKGIYTYKFVTLFQTINRNIYCIYLFGKFYFCLN